MMRTTKSFDRLNRLTGVTSLDALPSYISKKVWSNAEGTGSPDVDLRFAYDNWNLIAVLGPDFNAKVYPSSAANRYNLALRCRLLGKSFVVWSMTWSFEARWKMGANGTPNATVTVTIPW